LALLKGAHDRRTALGLHDDHSGSLPSDPAQRFELVERLVHAHDAGAAAGRIDDDIRQASLAPTALLRQFDTHRLLAFLAVGLLERRDVEPTIARRLLADQAARVADQALHQRDLGTVDAGFDPVQLGYLARH